MAGPGAIRRARAAGRGGRARSEGPQPSVTDDDGILHICVAGYGVSPDIGILALFPEA